MYIIPKDKIEKIESEVKPDYLVNVCELVKQGIAAAVSEVGSRITFKDSGLEQWCKKLGKDLMDCNTKIFYKKIIEALPESLMAIYKEFRTKYNHTIIAPDGKNYLLFEKQGWNKARNVADLDMAKKFLTECFPYHKFVSKNGQYDAYKYCKAMDINVCVYCNAQMTHTVIRKGGKKILRPQIDHFYPKSRFPMFALSFYNLIPVCQSCNFIKCDDFFDLSKIYHPYVDACTDLRFQWRYNKIWVVHGSEKARNMAKMLRTKDVYSMYIGVAEKIVEKVQDYNSVYIDDIMKLMNKHRPDGEKLDKKAVIRKIYGYVPKEECFETPLGEMRHDILADRIDKAYYD